MALREVLIFLAGAEAFHTICHVWLGVFGPLPLQINVPRMTLTAQLNRFAVVANAVVTVALLCWAARLGR